MEFKDTQSYIDYITSRNDYSKYSFENQEFKDLIDSADKLTREIFGEAVDFERSVFCTWSCKIGDCKYCYMSLQEDQAPTKVRSFASILAELIICKKYNWKVGYLTGGTGIIPDDKLFELCQLAHKVMGHKIHINFGSMSKRNLEKFSAHINGLGLAIETLDEQLHSHVCPSKPLSGLVKTLDNAKEMGLDTFMTIILGLGESEEDFNLLEEFLSKHKIDKIQFCLLKPQVGTIYENAPEPPVEYLAWWMAKTRLRWPEMKLKCAIVEGAIDDLDLIIKAGATSISRFPVIKKFNSESAKQICKRLPEFTANFTNYLDVNWQIEVDKLDLNSDMKKEILAKILRYDKLLQKNK